MKKLLSFLLIATLISSTAFSAQPIKRGEKAPDDGLFLTSDEARKLFGEVKEMDVLKKLNLSLNTSLDYMQDNNQMLQKKSNILMDQNLKLVTSLRDARTVSNWEKIMWFGLGVVGTGMAAYGVSRIK